VSWGERERERERVGGEERRADCCVWFLCVPVGMVESCRWREMRRAAAGEEGINPSVELHCWRCSSWDPRLMCCGLQLLASPLANSGLQGERAGGPGRGSWGEIAALLLHPWTRRRRSQLALCDRAPYLLCS
jgi:hypothetical protein